MEGIYVTTTPMVLVLEVTSSKIIVSTLFLHSSITISCDNTDTYGGPTTIALSWRMKPFQILAVLMQACRDYTIVVSKNMRVTYSRKRAFQDFFRKML